MGQVRFDVAIVGGGCAGLSAAIGLSKAGFSVVVMESAAFPGAENWSGCVYFCENLAHPDLLGPAGVEALAWERRVVERGTFLCDGGNLLGMTYRDPSAFRHCYTVLRPIYDHHLSLVAARCGAVMLNGTTVESLIRDGRRVIGVATSRGPVYADLTFLAEGDASHLVAREGYEQVRDLRRPPKFLHGIKQVIDMPPGAVERNFGLGTDEGAAYEVILRNGRLRGKRVHLNMGGFVYTNRQSLSIGLVLPADHLHDGFAGDPNLLMEWFENLPAVRRWCAGGSRGVFGAKLIRGGGVKEMPRLIDDGLAVGGAASGIGVDLPYPNFTGPATRMGLLLVDAVKQIRRRSGSFTQAELRTFYLEPLTRTHYWHDVEYLRHWPEYVETTRFFFDRNVDLALATAAIWTQPKRNFIGKWNDWIGMFRRWLEPGRWAELRADARQLSRALRLAELVDRPVLGRLLVGGFVNALRDLFRGRRCTATGTGTIQLHYVPAAGPLSIGPVPWPARRWYRRSAAALAAAAGHVYINDETPLKEKLRRAVRTLARAINLLDFGLVLLACATAALCTAIAAGWTRLKRAFRIGTQGASGEDGQTAAFEADADSAGDLSPWLPQAVQKWEARLGQLAYDSGKRSHIHLHWPTSLPQRNAVADQGLWHVCPAHVYEARLSPQGQLQVVVNFENCIKCETCWRTSPLVDWGRDGLHQFIYPVGTPAAGKLLEELERTDCNGSAAAILPSTHSAFPPNAEAPRAGDIAAVGQAWSRFCRTMDRLERKLLEFDSALGREPRTIGVARAAYLSSVAGYARQLGERLIELAKQVSAAQPSTAADAEQLGALVHEMLAQLSDMEQYAGKGRFTWAAASGRQVRQHHIESLKKIVALVSEPQASASGFTEYIRFSTTRLETMPGGTAVADSRHIPDDGQAGPDGRSVMTAGSDPLLYWTRPDDLSVSDRDWLAAAAKRLDQMFAPLAWRDVDKGQPLTPGQDRLLQDLADEALAAGNGTGRRRGLLIELGRRIPALGYRVACHLWGRHFHPQGEGWAALVVADDLRVEGGRCYGEAHLVPQADEYVVLIGDHLAVWHGGEPGPTVETIATLGLRGAALRRLKFAGTPLPADASSIDRRQAAREFHIQSSLDLAAIACGMATTLTDRSTAHAASRVQFPGLFHDEQSRDAIGKFGAVKKMLAEMAARQYLMETLSGCLDPSDASEENECRCALAKAIIAEALGCSLGSVSYNAGQVFGGTGFSEDDILSMYYRDAAAWRFLGQANTAIWSKHGGYLWKNWHVEGRRLASFDGEAELFDEVSQRKALQQELDQLRVLRARLRNLAAEWLSAASPAGCPGTIESLARQDACLMAAKALLLRTHALLESGVDAEDRVAFLRVWLDHVRDSLDAFEHEQRPACAADPSAILALRELQERPGNLQEGEAPVVAGSAESQRDCNASDMHSALDAGSIGVLLYEEYLKSPGEYNSGDFLHRPVTPAAPRYLPELVETDPALAEVDAAFRQAFQEHFAPRGDKGECYERYVERRHGPDPEDLEFLRRRGALRMFIPSEVGGCGRRRAEYYLLTCNAQQYADFSIALTIQVNSSLGTVPVLLARDKDLPRAIKELESFIAEEPLQREIGERIAALARAAGAPGGAIPAQEFQGLHAQVDRAVLSRSVLRRPGQPFADAWAQAARAVKAADLPAFQRRIAEAVRAWNDLGTQAIELRDELQRRRAACDLCLRWISSGQISAFALTEPAAGSDTARVVTRAHLHSVEVEREADGVLRFVPAGQEAQRYLLDADRIEFRSDGVYYRWGAAGEASPIHFDEYDYATDNPARTRYYFHGPRRIDFTDVAQLRQRHGRLWYDYWELNGAKMWITNGRMCGVMIVYAKTPEGVTGFWADRHAEGLVIGKDEEKMGQCGSPTNEVSLQNVRVPRENTLGLEGRGQVNALDTLNVGRAGIAMSAMTFARDLAHRCRQFIVERSPGATPPDHISWRLDRIEENVFAAEAVAFETIGRFEHRQTRSVRMESAIAKAMATELLHEVIDLAEEIYGPEGQTAEHLVEKRRRDARVLNIYEGTNEIQRFLILRELLSEVLPRFAELPSMPEAAPTPSTISPSSNRLVAGGVRMFAAEISELIRQFRLRLQTAFQLFGQDLWQNANLQPSCFLLSECAAWLKVMDSALARLAWLEAWGGNAAVEGGSGGQSSARDGPDGSRRGPGAAPSERARDWEAKQRAGRRVMLRAAGEVRRRLLRFDEELVRLQRGWYANVIRAAELMFDRASHPPAEGPTPLSSISRTLSVLVVVEPGLGNLPRPFVQDGRLLEPHRALTEGDRAALETVLRWRDAANGRVHVTVAAVGSRALLPVLREVLALGVDRTLLVHHESDRVSSSAAAAALVEVLRRDSRTFDVVVGPSGNPNLEEGLLASLVACRLGMATAGPAAHVAICHDERVSQALWTPAGGGRPKRRALPVALRIQPGLGLRQYSTTDYFSCLSRHVDIVPWPDHVEMEIFHWTTAAAADVGLKEPAASALAPPAAAEFLRQRLGLTAAPVAGGEVSLVIADVASPSLLADRDVIAVISAEAGGSLTPAGLALVQSAAAGACPAVVLLTPGTEEDQVRAAEAVVKLGVRNVLLVPQPDECRKSAEIRCRYLLECWPRWGITPRLVLGEPWTEGAFARLAVSADAQAKMLFRARRFQSDAGRLEVETARMQGKLRARHAFSVQDLRPCWITCAADVEAAATGPRPSDQREAARIERWMPPPQAWSERDDMQRLLDELKESAGVVRLAEADFIIDVGYGIGNRDGYEEIIPPLEKALRDLGVERVAIGGSRKVTEELHLLPPDRQIGQSGVSVNPQILLAIGISGAPQHLAYVGPQATILSFNRDPEAPIMTLNQRQPRPKVFPVVGDLFKTVPAFVAALRKENRRETPAANLNSPTS